MTSPIVAAPKVFISYSHEPDSPEHADHVLELSDRLCDDGIDCILDQYESSPPEGWQLWMDKNIRDADFVLMVCTETYYKRVMGEEKPGTGLGVRWEGNLSYQHLYHAGTLNTRFIPVLFEDADVSCIPTPFKGATYYRPDTQKGYEDLRRRLTSQPYTVKPPVGTPPILPPRKKKPDFFAPWNVPSENTYFTGRDSIIKNLRDALCKDSVGALSQAISGLGGIGKTQIAVEYAYRFREKYSAVFWVRSSTELDLSSSFIEMARMLDLPEKDARDSNEIVHAVKRWLENNAGWLLIFDNADSPEMCKDFRPLDPKGHILLTSRAQVFQALGIAKPIEIDQMLPGEALDFLCKRTGREKDDSVEKSAAEALAEELGYFPLALEQAGAYITTNQVRFQDYLAVYRKRRLELLAESKAVAGDYRESVNTTWALNFSEVKKASEAAADLLRFSAFLSPDSIPLELLVTGASQLSPSISAAIGKAEDETITVSKILEPLTCFSLIRRDISAQTYSIHRLVQEVLKHGMDKKTCRFWAERTVRALDEAFPPVEFANWALCDRLLPHGKAAAELIEGFGFEFHEAARLLNQVGFYLNERGRYAEAEPMYRRSLAIWEKALGHDHPYVAASLNNLAELYREQGRYAEAEPLYKRSLAIWEKVKGQDHPDVATSLNNLALLYWTQGKYADAEPLYKRSLAIREKALGQDHPAVAISLNNLAALYHDQGRYAEAEPLFQRSLAIYEKALGHEHPDVATVLENYAGLLRKTDRVSEAAEMEKRAAAIRKKHAGKSR